MTLMQGHGIGGKGIDNLLKKFVNARRIEQIESKGTNMKNVYVIPKWNGRGNFSD